MWCETFPSPGSVKKEEAISGFSKEAVDCSHLQPLAHAATECLQVAASGCLGKWLQVTASGCRCSGS